MTDIPDEMGRWRELRRRIAAVFRPAPQYYNLKAVKRDMVRQVDEFRRFQIVHIYGFSPREAQDKATHFVACEMYHRGQLHLVERPHPSYVNSLTTFPLSRQSINHRDDTAQDRRLDSSNLLPTPDYPQTMMAILQPPYIHQNDPSAGHNIWSTAQSSAPLLPDKTTDLQSGTTQNLLQSLLVHNQRLMQRIKDQAELLDERPTGIQQPQGAQHVLFEKYNDDLKPAFLCAYQGAGSASDDRASHSVSTPIGSQLDNSQPPWDRIKAKAEADTLQFNIKVGTEDAHYIKIKVEGNDTCHIRIKDEAESSDIHVKVMADSAAHAARPRRSLRRRKRGRAY